MEFKGTGACLVKDIDGKSGTVVAYWSAFNNRDDGADIMMPGAWSRSIAERGPQSAQPRVKFLYQHDEKMLVATPSELTEDDFGLLATYTIPQTTLGKDVLLLYDAGVISEHSVGYQVKLSQWDKAQQARLLQECVLWEGSAVTWGMNSQTPVVAVKALSTPDYLAQLAQKAEALDKLLHSGNLRSEQLCESLQRELKALQTALAPAPAADSAPYTIKGVLEAMTQLNTRIKTSSSTKKIEDEAPETVVVEIDGHKLADALEEQLGDALDQKHVAFIGTHTHEIDGKGSVEHTHFSAQTHEQKDDGQAAMPADGGEDMTPDFATMYATERDAWSLMSELQGMMSAMRSTVVGCLCGGDLSTLGASLSQFSSTVEAWANDVAGQECWAEVAQAAQAYGGEPWDYLSRQIELDEKSPAPKTAPDAPARIAKAGRVISGTNRNTLTKAADGIADAMAAMKEHHAAIADLLDATDPAKPAANEQDDGDKPADDEKAVRRAAAGSTPQADTTLDTKALLALFGQLSEVLQSRRVPA